MAWTPTTWTPMARTPMAWTTIARTSMAVAFSHGLVLWLTPFAYSYGLLLRLTSVEENWLGPKRWHLSQYDRSSFLFEQLVCSDPIYIYIYALKQTNACPDPVSVACVVSIAVRFKSRSVFF